jgi:DNA (cytosine-5)-methyltransferase 1
MTHGSLFSGIGGFDLAAEWMGWENKFHCEWNPFGKKVLNYYWPNAESFDDITKTNFTKYAGTIDIISGGFPCQPYSSAGKRLGKEDARHLWPEMLRVIREVRPRWVVGENVRGLVSWNEGMVFDEVQSDLEAIGFEVLPFLLAAASVNAPHRRDRIFFIAHSQSEGSWEQSQTDRGGEDRRLDNNGEIRNATNANCAVLEHRNGQGETGERAKQKERIESFNSPGKWEAFPTVSPVCNGDDGLSDRLDSITFPKWRNESIKAGGNAIVPQVAFQIFKSIAAYEKACEI